MRAYTISVTTSAQLVVPTAAEAAASGQAYVGTPTIPKSFHLYNAGPNTVFLGGPTVTTAQGFPLANAASVEIDLASDAIYVISAAGGETLNVLATNG